MVLCEASHSTTKRPLTAPSGTFSNVGDGPRLTATDRSGSEGRKRSSVGLQQLVRCAFQALLFKRTTRTLYKARLYTRRRKPVMATLPINRNVWGREIRVNEASNGYSILLG